MQYKLCNVETNARTSGYMGSVITQGDRTLAALKKNVAKHNAHVREVSRQYGRPIGELMRVRLMGRGPRAVHARREHRYPRAYDSYLPMHLAEYFDVYQGVDPSAQYELKRELDTGMRPGELKKYDKFREAQRMIEMMGHMRKRGDESSEKWFKERLKNVL